MPEILVPLSYFMKSRCEEGNGIAFVDSTPLRVCKNCDEILSFQITRGNVDDRNPVPTLVKGFVGKVFTDKSYISKKLALDDITLITTLKKNMKYRPLEIVDKILLRKRSIIETINDQLKNICQLEHSRHRSLSNYTYTTSRCRI